MWEKPFMLRLMPVYKLHKERLSLGFSMYIETDASMVVQAVKSVDYDRCSAGGLIWELKILLVSNFVSYDVNHIPRSCNMVADSLAALGASLSLGAAPILDSVPSCTRVLVAKDLASE